MKSITTTHDSSQPVADTAVYLFDDWFVTLERPRYGRRPQSSSSASDGRVAVIGHRHGHRSRSLMGTFGRIEIEVPRARLNGPGGKTTEWNSQVLRAYCMSSEHVGQLAWQFKRMSGSSGLKVQAAIAC